MKKQFSQIESQWVMDKFLETHKPECVRMYQQIDAPHILIVSTISSSLYELKKLEDMNISATMFAEGSEINHYLSKL